MGRLAQDHVRLLKGLFDRGSVSYVGYIIDSIPRSKSEGLYHSQKRISIRLTGDIRGQSSLLLAVIVPSTCLATIISTLSVLESTTRSTHVYDGCY